ncbi:hypothetical protein [Marilutibacter chinensis]|uniref:hypothetical protein n=1 Tax=Marilutibacter chinensis TaxID=2912247 RepID=UPI003CCE22A8
MPDERTPALLWVGAFRIELARDERLPISIRQRAVVISAALPSHRGHRGHGPVQALVWARAGASGTQRSPFAGRGLPIRPASSLYPAGMA